jgi:hypothetical protein
MAEDQEGLGLGERYQTDEGHSTSGGMLIRPGLTSDSKYLVGSAASIVAISMMRLLAGDRPDVSRSNIITSGSTDGPGGGGDGESGAPLDRTGCGVCGWNGLEEAGGEYGGAVAVGLTGCRADGRVLSMGDGGGGGPAAAAAEEEAAGD